MQIRHGRAAFALMFSIAMLALMSVLGVTFVSLTQVDRRLGRNFVDLQRAQIAAESGLDFALGRVLEMADGPFAPRDYALERYDNDGALLPSGYLERSATIAVPFYVHAEDESGKLNLNDPDTDGRLENMLRLLVENLRMFGAIDSGGVADDPAAVAKAVLLDPEYGRIACGGRFARFEQMDKAFERAGLSMEDIAELRRHVTIYSWTNPHTLKTNANVHGTDLQGATLEMMDERRIARWLEFQTREFALEPRSPVNVNTASLALLAALIEPLEGLFLAEGPADWQSAEHYGWWATGLGEPDPNRDNYGRIIRTRRFTKEEALRLAVAMNTRIHGQAGIEEMEKLGLDYHDMVMPILPADDEDDGKEGEAAPLTPNPFETWDEFRDFLEHGLVDPDGGGPKIAGHEIFVGEGFSQFINDMPVVMNNHPAAPLFDDRYVDPHAELSADALDKTTGVRAMVYSGGVTWDDMQYRSFYAGSLTLPMLRPFLIATSGSDVPVAWNSGHASDWRNAYYSQGQRDMLYANFNPNSLLNDWNPDRNRYLMVDKAQLLQSTTEFCFAPSGYFSFTSRGTVERVVDGGANEVLALRSLSAVVQCFEIRHVTTQAQFLDGASKADDLRNYFSKSGSLYAPNSPVEYLGTACGAERLALQSYPEAVFPGGEDRIRRMMYDGAILPASLETTLDKHVDRGFVAHFNGDDDRPLCIDDGSPAPAPYQPGDPLYDAALAGGDAAIPEEAPEEEVPEGELPVEYKPDAPLVGDMPGTLYPDGTYSEMGRVLAYRFGNINDFDGSRGLRGLVSFWLKPNFHTGVSTRIRKFMSGPSQRGRYAIQQFAALYLFPNANNNNTDGQTGNGRVSSSLVNGLDLYGFPWRNYWMPTHAMAFGFAWQPSKTWVEYEAGDPDDPEDDWEFHGGLRNNFAQASCFSRAVTRDFPLAKDCNFAARPAEQFHNVLGHQWSHIAAMWSGGNEGAYANSFKGLQARFCINGMSVCKGAPLLPAAQAQYYPGGSTLGPRGQTQSWVYGSNHMNQYQSWGPDINFNGDWLRFGELPGKLGMGASDPAIMTNPPPVPTSDQPSPYHADSTIDEIAATGDLLGGFPLELQSKSRLACSAWFAGRYHSAPEDPEGVGIPTIGVYTTPPITACLATDGGSLSLRSIAWTVYRPRFNRANDKEGGWDDSVRDNVEGDVINNGDRPDPAVLALLKKDAPPADAPDFMTVDFAANGDADPGEANTWHFAGADEGRRRLTYPGGTVLRAADRALYRAGDHIRLRLSFHIAKENAAGMPQRLWEAPALDDITLTFSRLQPKMLEFRLNPE